MSTRRDDCFTALKIIRRTVDATHEAIEAALQDPVRDRALLDEWRAEILHPIIMRTSTPSTQGTDLAFIQKIAATVTLLHSTGHLLISERETLAKALASISLDLENADIPPRTQNLGKAGRPKKGKPS